MAMYVVAVCWKCNVVCLTISAAMVGNKTVNLCEQGCAPAIPPAASSSQPSPQSKIRLTPDPSRAERLQHSSFLP